MKFYRCIALIIVSMGIFSCTVKEDEVAKLKSEVISIHDEVMPKMGELKSYQKSLIAMEEELQKTPADSSEIQLIKQAAIACGNAYEGMFVWMRQFDSKLEGMDEGESLTYLQGQLIKVTQVNQDIKQALYDAEKIMKK